MWPTRLVAGVALVSSVVLLGAVSWPRLIRRPLARHVVVSRPSGPSVVVARSKVTPDVRSDPAQLSGPYGAQSRQIELENALQGTTAWKIPSGVATDAIQGFADHVYAVAGDSVGLYVSTRATHFRVEAFRMGYYGGAGARLVWRSSDIVGSTQRPCRVTATTNLVSCESWTRSLTLRVSSQFVQGDYLLKLVASGNAGQSYVPLTVWDPGSHAAYVIKNDVFTWQAWNTYGGYDFYAGKGTCPSSVYPLCSRARVVSFDRPYASAGAADFLGNEYPLVRFAEEHHLDVAYATDLTVQQHPDFLLAHQALLSLGHDECWSRIERQAAVAAVAHGVNIVYFAASPMLRHIRLQASAFGPDREEVDYRNAAEDPLNGKANPLDVTGNTWSAPPSNWSEDSFVGAAYAGFLEPDAEPAAFAVADGSAWIFQNTGLVTGSVIPGLLRSDFDHFEIGTHPRGEEILAHSRVPLAHAQSLIGTAEGRVYSDMTYYSDLHSGAGVLDTGTNNWIPALTACPQTIHNCPAPSVQQITANLLRIFGAGPAGRSQPPRSNWHQYY